MRFFEGAVGVFSFVATRIKQVLVVVPAGFSNA